MICFHSDDFHDGWCFNAMADSLAIFMATNKFKCNKTAILKAIQGVKKLLLVKTLKWIQG